MSLTLAAANRQAVVLGDTRNLLLGCVLVLMVYLIARKLSPRPEGSFEQESWSPPDSPAPQPQAPCADPLRGGNAAAITPELPQPSIPNIRIRNIYFATFDLLPGPPDPGTFCDELFVDLYDADTGHKWTSSYEVATPKGLAEMLRSRGWDLAWVDSMLIVNRYDLREVWSAVVERIEEEQAMGRSGVAIPEAARPEGAS